MTTEKGERMQFVNISHNFTYQNYIGETPSTRGLLQCWWFDSKDLSSLKGQSHEKNGKMRVQGDSLGPN
jgi:hypothetical protein